jgi:cell division protease FtsH
MPGGGGGMDSSLVNELLTQMDGIDQPPRLAGLWRRLTRRPLPQSISHNILVVAATNRAETLDPALLRPGRFDRKVHVGLPGEDGRRDVLAYYLARVAHVPIDIGRLAKTTVGYSPARLKMLVNEGLIFARRSGRDALTYDDIRQAKLHDEVGLAEPVQYTAIEKRITAVHEAGHAVAAQFLLTAQTVEIVTIRKRGHALGMVQWQADEERYGRQRSEMINRIQVALAGMVAEEIWFGESSDGPSADIDGATWVAVTMIGHYGMGSEIASHNTLSRFGGRPLMDPDIRKEVDGILQECKASIRTFLEEHRIAVEVVRDALLAQNELSGDEFRALLLEKGLIAKLRPTTIPLPILPPDGDPGEALHA